MTASAPALAADLLDIGANWTAEVYRAWSFPDEVLSWWRRASKTQGDIGLFTHPGWMEQCWSAWGEPGALLVFVLRQHDRIRGILPCHFGTTNFGYRGIASLPVNVTHYDILTEGDPEAVVEAFVRVIERHYPACHLQFDCLPEPPAQLIRRAFEARRFATWTHSEPLTRYLSVDGEWDSLLASFARTFRGDLRRRHRLAEQDPALTWSVYRDSSGLQDHLTEAFDVETRSWKGRAGTAVMQVPAFEKFLRLACAWAAREKKLYFRAMRHHGRMDAFLIAFVNGGTSFAYETSFDDQAESRCYSPGMLTTFEILRELTEDPAVHRFGILGKASAFKERWSRQAEMYHWVTVYPRTMTGQGQYLLRHAWKEPLKKSATVQRILEKLRTLKEQK